MTGAPLGEPLAMAYREIDRLREALLWIAVTPTGIPGHAVAVGCPHPREAAEVLGVLGMDFQQARLKLGTKPDAEAAKVLAVVAKAHQEEFERRAGWTTADRNTASQEPSDGA